MKVLFSIAQIGGISGGAERVFTDVCNGLEKRGYEVTVVTFDPSDDPPFYPLNVNKFINLFPKRARKASNRNLIKNFAVEGLRKLYRSLPNNFPFDSLKWRTVYSPLIRSARKLVNNQDFDAVVAFLPPAFTIWHEALEGSNTPLILSTHNVPERDFEQTDRWDQNSIVRRIRRAAILKANKINVLIPEAIEYFAKIRESTEGIHVVPNMIKPFDNPPTVIKENLVISVGRLEPVKQHSLLIEAWSKLGGVTNWRLEIYGDGSLRDELQKQIESLGLQERVFLRGAISGIGEIYSRAKFMVHPAKFEGACMSVAEGLKSGLPIVYFANTPGISHWLDSRNSLSANTPNELSAKMKELIVNEELLTDLSTNAPLAVEHLSENFVLDLWESTLNCKSLRCQ